MDPEQIFITLSQLKSASGGTSLITYFLPGNYSVWLSVEKLVNEQGTAKKIKCKQVSKDTEQALKSLLHQLKNYKLAKTPENGLVLCSGIVEENKSCF